VSFHSPFVVLFIVEFVDVVPARLCQGNMEILSRVVGPVLSIGKEIDEVGEIVVVRVGGDGLLAMVGSVLVASHVVAPFVG
jgi:hypothetical protein